MKRSNDLFWIVIIFITVVIISALHYLTPTMKWQYHLVYMQAYFIPIILAAFRFGVRGGLGTAFLVTVFYIPHIMLHWGGLVENNLMRFLQICLFNVLGYLTGLKAQGEHEEKEKLKQTARELERSLEKEKQQSEIISDMEQQLQASDRLATIGELTASLAHEIRNPLGAIRGAVEIIRDAVPEEIKKLEFFDILIQDTERLNGVVENYLSFAKKQSPQTQKYDLLETIQRIVFMLEPRLRKNQIQIHTPFMDSKLTTIGNPVIFWQVMMNILLNAIQAMADGGNIRISVKEIQAMDNGWNEPLESGQSQHKFGQISICDEGKGIDPDELNNIFKPFYTTRSDGTGLGLAIVKRLVDENQWKMKVKSELGKGSEFIISIPLHST